MSSSSTGNKTHDATVNAAEAARQSTVVTTASRATVVAAEVTFFKAAVASAITNAVNPVPFMTAMREAGRGSEGF